MIDELLKEIEEKKELFFDEIKNIQSPEQLRQIDQKYTSRKKGVLTEFISRIKDIPSEFKPLAGKALNDFKQVLNKELGKVKKEISPSTEHEIDYSLPEFVLPAGHFHLITYMGENIEDIFISMGYEVVYGPEVESEYNNFTALNIPKYHPARDEQDTFFIKGFEETVLRTHTSPVQIQFMNKNKPPLKIISPGKVFRKDEPDATHTPVFHQIEGLLVDKNINLSHLKGTLELFIKLLFGENINIRFRQGYFPFTEPSVEVDISCFSCAGNKPNCRICKGTGWLEILGSGMVHPRVLMNCHIDPDVYAGFAFGMGVERIAMLKYGFPDLRLLYENDIRFLNQFG